MPMAMKIRSLPRLHFVASLRFIVGQGHGEGLRLIGDRHEVDMIHEAISKNAKASLRGVGLEAVEIGVTAGICKENPLLVNATLHDVVCRSNGAGA